MDTERKDGRKGGRGPSVPPGPTALRVAENIKALRQKRGFTLDELKDRLVELGQPASKSSLWKIEAGTRRVDVDELMALAIALQVTPNRLLLGPVVDDWKEPGGLVSLAPTLGVTTPRDAWTWASGEGRVQGRKEWGSVNALRWMAENRPHRPPVRLSLRDWQKIDPFVERFDELRAEVVAAGFDVRALFDDVVFETRDDEVAR